MERASGVAGARLHPLCEFVHLLVVVGAPIGAAWGCSRVLVPLAGPLCRAIGAAAASVRGVGVSGVRPFYLVLWPRAPRTLAGYMDAPVWPNEHSCVSKFPLYKLLKLIQWEA